MSPIGNLIAFALRQALGIEASAAIDAIENRLTDHTQVLPKAIDRANARAWQALAVALAGEGLFDQVKVLFASGDEKAFREEVRRFLADSPVRYDRNPADFRKKCLTELHQARRAGLLSPDGITARQVAQFDRFADPTRLVNGAWQAIGQVAAGLKPQCPNLAKLIGHQTPGKPPLLIAAFAYFFRREVETNSELAHGLFFDDLRGLRQLSASQEKALGNIGQTLAALDGRFDAVLEKLGGIEAKVDAVHGAVLKNAAVAVEVRVDVLDVKAEQQRLGQQFGEMYGLLVRLQEQHQLQHRPLRSQDSLSIRNDHERQLIKQVKALYRGLPKQQQRQLPAALNAIGKLEDVAGDFEDAQRHFQRVAGLVNDPKSQAEAHYNGYTVALERRDWPLALRELICAVKLDPKSYAPFPMGKYAPQRILGAGGFGVAFLCKHKYMDAQVVVKALLTDDLERDVEKVFAEAHALRQLDHPTIVRLQDCAYINPATRSRPYLVMDYFEGITLEEHVRVHGPLDVEALLAIARPTAEALQAAHAKGILHRDVKPGNLLVRRDSAGWQIRLIDFGLAVGQKKLQTTKEQTGARHRTVSGESIAGTLDYAPPEQLGRLTGFSAAPCSDVYGFAKTCCYALFQTPQPTFPHWKQIPESLAVLLGECLAEKPQERPADFTQVLARMLTSRSPSVAQNSAGQDRRVDQPLEMDDFSDTPVESPAPSGQLCAFCNWPRKGLEKFCDCCGCVFSAASTQADSAAADAGDQVIICNNPACGAVRKGLEEYCGKCGSTFAAAPGWQEPANSIQEMLQRAAKGTSDNPVEADFQECNRPSGGDDYLRKHAPSRLKHWSAAAEEGSQAGLWLLGMCLRKGIGIAEDHVKATQCFCKHLKKVTGCANDDLGYKMGWGIPKDLWRKAAKGDPTGEARLAIAFEEGSGVPQDYTQAALWFRKAAKQGKTAVRESACQRLRYFPKSDFEMSRPGAKAYFKLLQRICENAPWL